MAYLEVEKYVSSHFGAKNLGTMVAWEAALETSGSKSNHYVATDTCGPEKSTDVSGGAMSDAVKVALTGGGLVKAEGHT